MAEFRFSSAKPISRNVANFDSIFSAPPPTFVPNTLDCLLTRSGGDGGYALAVSGEVGGDICECLVVGREDETDRRPKLKRFPGFGGNGGGWSSELRVLPVSWRTAGRMALAPEKLC